ncbi:MAG: TMEM43 family protein [Flavobacteriales bacterium]
MALGKKVKGSIGAIIFGLILILAGISGTWWNEGRTIKTHKGLEQGAQSVHTSKTIDYISPENDAKLIHISGSVNTSETLSDGDFGLNIPHLKLKREVEMYQWKENKETKNEENSEENSTTYSYSKDWSQRLIDSQNFNDPTSHQNPKSKKYESFSKSVSKASLGAHLLNPKQISRLNNWVELKFSEISPVADAQIMSSEGRPTQIYIGNTSLENPEIGNLRISYQVVYEGDYTLIAKQTGDSFEPFTTEKGTEINLLKTGIHSSESMFDEELSENNFLKWLFRVIGFVVLFIGVRLLFSLVTLFTNFIPIIGSIVNFGVSLFSGIVAFCVFVIVAGIAWVFYRPVLGITLLVIGIGILLFFSEKGKKLKARISESLT